MTFREDYLHPVGRGAQFIEHRHAHPRVDGPDRLWLTDITEHPTGKGTLYCAAVLDAYSRLVIGWSCC